MEFGGPYAKGGARRRKTMMYSFPGRGSPIITFHIPWREDTWKILAFNLGLGPKLGSFSRLSVGRCIPRLPTVEVE